jgi:hypothetical protein
MPQTLERPAETSAAPIDYTKKVVKVRPLTGHDRCDAGAVNRHAEHKVFEGKGKGSCGAQAFVLAVMPDGTEFTFCGHHVGKQKTSNAKDATLLAALKAAGALIHDEYDTINGKPTM